MLTFAPTFAVVTTFASASVCMGSQSSSTMDWKQFHDGMLTLLEMSLAMHGKIKPLHHQHIAIFVTVALFLVSVVIFVPNSLIARLVFAYERSTATWSDLHA